MTPEQVREQLQDDPIAVSELDLFDHEQDISPWAHRGNYRVLLGRIVELRNKLEESFEAAQIEAEHPGVLYCTACDFRAGRSCVTGDQCPECERVAMRPATWKEEAQRGWSVLEITQAELEESRVEAARLRGERDEWREHEATYQAEMAGLLRERHELRERVVELEGALGAAERVAAREGGADVQAGDDLTIPFAIDNAELVAENTELRRRIAAALDQLNRIDLSDRAAAAVAVGSALFVLSADWQPPQPEESEGE